MNFEDAVEGLFGRHDRRRPLPNRSMHRLDQGVFHFDFRDDDPDNVYLVTVERVPRVRLPLEPPVVVGEVDGVRALLVRVSVANHVEVTLDAEDSPRTRTLTEAYLAAEAVWVNASGPDQHPPESPGAERFLHLLISVTDDAGTEYHMSSGSGGGSDTPWRMHWDFLPVPPPQARRLTIHFPAGEVEFALPPRP